MQMRPSPHQRDETAPGSDALANLSVLQINSHKHVRVPLRIPQHQPADGGLAADKRIVRGAHVCVWRLLKSKVAWNSRPGADRALASPGLH